MDKALSSLVKPEILCGLTASYRVLALDGAPARAVQFDAILREVEAHDGAVAVNQVLNRLRFLLRHLSDLAHAPLALW